MTIKSKDLLEQQLLQLQTQQQQLQLQLQENNRRMQHIVRRVWQLTDSTQKRLANDLHDGVGQVLTALVNDLSAADFSPERREHVKELAKMALQDVRQISRLLRPPILDDLGLAAALSWLIRHIKSPDNALDITLSMPPDLQLDDELQIMIYRICQEALTNTVKYANASKVSVSLSSDNNTLHLLIADDGIGFELHEQSNNGVGLYSIQDRAAAMGGWALIETEPGQGCCIKVAIPRKAV